MSEVAEELIEKIKVARVAKSSACPSPKLPPPRSRKDSPAVGAQQDRRHRHLHRRPQALQFMLIHLPADFPGAILVVQHMPEGFTEMFARRLNETCALEVKEAQSGDMVLAGRVLICPGNRHMKVKRMPLGNVVVLADGEVSTATARPSMSCSTPSPTSSAPTPWTCS